MRSAARRRAERARGLARISSASGRTGRLVSTRRRRLPPQMQTGLPGGQLQPLRRVAEAVLHDAVLERVVGDHHQTAAGTQRLDGGLEPLLERAELVVDGDAQRLEDQRGGVVAAAAARPASRAISASRSAACAAGRGGASRRWRGPARGRPAARRSRGSSARSCSAESVASRSAAVVGALRSMRMSSGVSPALSAAKRKPRSGRSSCGDETPRSRSTPSTRAMPSFASTSASERNEAWIRRTRAPKGSRRWRAAASASSSRSRATSSPAGAVRSRIAPAWPPPPTVPSTMTPPERRVQKRQGFRYEDRMVLKLAAHRSGAPPASPSDGPLSVEKVWGAPEHRLPRERFVPPSNAPLTAESRAPGTPPTSLWRSFLAPPLPPP